MVARTASLSYLPGIDGLRAIAVLSVVLFHLDAALLPGGFIGVDVFFVISGYVISMSLSRSNAAGLGEFLLEFYKRRVLRIFPALLACLVITGIVSAMYIPDAWLSEHNDDTALWAFFGVSNFYLVGNADGYFSERIPFNPFIHTWSLAVEEQFYVFFPLIFYIWMQLRSNRSHHHKIAFAVLPLIALASLLLASFETELAPARAFYLLPSRFWELAAGAMLFQMRMYRPDLFEAPPSWIFPTGFVLLLLGLLLTDEAAFPFPWALIPVIATLLLIAGSTSHHAAGSYSGRLLTMPMVTYVGRISYSLYLWHWPVFTLARWTSGLDAMHHRVLAVLLTFALAIVSYHVVENPLRRSGKLRREASWKIVFGGVITIVGTFFLMRALFMHPTQLGLNQSVTADSCVWRPAYQPECIAEPVTPEPSHHQLFLIGDSHAGAYRMMAQSAARRLGAGFQFRTRSGCPLANLLEPMSASGPCAGVADDTIEWLKTRSHSGDVVFIASLRMHRGHLE